MPTHARCLRSAAPCKLARSWSPKRMTPVVTGVERARQRSSVVLPAPDLPMTATNSPGRIAVVTFSRARLRAKHFVTWCNVIVGDRDIGGGLYLGRGLNPGDSLSLKGIEGDRHHLPLA